MYISHVLLHIAVCCEFDGTETAFIWPDASVNSIVNFQIILRIRSIRTMLANKCLFVGMHWAMCAEGAARFEALATRLKTRISIIINPRSDGH